MSAESWVEAVNAAIAQFRAGAIDSEKAVEFLKALGVLEGEAIRWLGKVLPIEATP